MKYRVTMDAKPQIEVWWAEDEADAIEQATSMMYALQASWPQKVTDWFVVPGGVAVEVVA